MEQYSIKQSLSALRIGNLIPDLEGLMFYCEKQKMTPRQTLAYVLKSAVQCKQQNKTEMLTKMARFPGNYTIENYDFSLVKVDEPKIHELADCSWIENGENVLFKGSFGLGKTHLAVALGRRAIAKGYSTLFISANEFFSRMCEADRRDRLTEALKLIDRNQLVILDDIGHFSQKIDLSSIFYDFVNNRYKKRSILITTNMEIDAWAGNLGHVPTVSASIDRLMERLHCVPFDGQSYRCRQFQARQLEQIELFNEVEIT